jgi:ABC-type branched-subunit amino acid transport system ATPase component/ABC-type branched-subunit amino acid transport system permease subunit
MAGLVALTAGEGSATIVARGTGFALALGSLVVLTGWSGQLNLHVAAIGLGWGAYAAAGLAINGVAPVVAILVAPIVVTPAALLVGVVAVRFRGLELAIATLAAGLAFEQAFFQSLGKWLAHATTGSAFQSSLIEIARPSWLAGDRAYALFAMVVAGAWLGAAALAGRGRAGRTLRAVRDREVVAEARGVPVYAWRVGAFAGSTALAAAGGALFAAQTGAVTPDSFGFSLSLQMLAVATLGRIRRLEGALLGAALLVLAQEAGGIGLLSWISGDRADLVFGAGLILVLFVRSRRHITTPTVTVHPPGKAPTPPAPKQAAGFAPTLLRVEGVRAAFGPRAVLDGINLRVGEGEVVGLVGPNGAGKTTLFNCITGLVVPQSGRVYFGGADITEMPPHRRAHLGLARTFQGIEVFEGLTIEEGLMISARLREGGHGERTLRTRARAALASVGIEDVADAEPESLPFAKLRLVEISSALVAEPRLVLLDEPLAGLDAAERSGVLAAIAGLREHGRSVLLVEHDTESVVKVADRVYRLEDGRATTPSVRRRATSSARARGGRVAARA